MVEYDDATLDAAADELDAMPRPSIIADVMMPDYAVMRAQARACG